VQAEAAARLALALPPDASAWGVAEVEAESGRARLVLYAAREAVVARLDAECGKTGWSFTLAPLGASALVANLTALGVTRAAVVAALAVGVASSADVALAACAASFGLALPFVREHESYWVDFDVEAGEPLFLPEPVAVPGGQVAGQAPAELPAPGPSREEVLATRNGTGGPGAGHQVIERLVERLKELGLGKEAARLVVRYQGYGRTPEESRELYGRLRALLPGVGAS